MSYQWQSSSDDANWDVVGTDRNYVITSADEGKSIRSVISYTNAQGFEEVVTTASTTIPFVDDGDA